MLLWVPVSVHWEHLLLLLLLLQKPLLKKPLHREQKRTPLH